MATAHDLFAAVLDTPVAAGAGGLIIVIFGYLFKELRRKDDGVWAIIAEKDRQLKAKDTEIAFWRGKVLREEDEAHESHVHEEAERHERESQAETDRHRREGKTEMERHRRTRDGET